MVGIDRIDQDVPPKTSNSVRMVVAYSSGEVVPTATQNGATGHDTLISSEDGRAVAAAAAEDAEPRRAINPTITLARSARRAGDHDGPRRTKVTLLRWSVHAHDACRTPLRRIRIL